jgi:hypothetical protein
VVDRRVQQLPADHLAGEEPQLEAGPLDLAREPSLRQVRLRLRETDELVAVLVHRVRHGGQPRGAHGG